MLKFIFLSVTCLLLFRCTNDANLTTPNASNTSIDSCEYFLAKAKTKGISKAAAELNLRKALYFSNDSNDSLSGRRLGKIAFRYYTLGNLHQFKILNEKALELSLKLKDTFAIGDVYWNYANMYKQLDVNDSAYIYFKKAHQFFDTDDHQDLAAKMLYNMSVIQGKFKNLSISEQLVIRSISIFKKLDDSKSLYACYNHLAILQNDMEAYDRALEYHKSALEYLDKLPNPEKFKQTSYNNIGNTYLKKGDYAQALTYFNPLVSGIDLSSKISEGEARIIDNWAYCRFNLHDTLGLSNIFKRNLKIQDSLDNKEGVILSNLRLAKYTYFQHDTLGAYAYASRAKSLSRDYKNGSNYLESLLLLSKLEIPKSAEYLKEYIRFSDSLASVEVQNKNKFARIAYETDEYIRANRQLSKEKVLIILIGCGVTIILLLIFAIWIQRSKNEKLVLEGEQQKASEQLYKLTQQQQVLLENERVEEQKRISEELHDGVLGKLFGLRMSLGFKSLENKVTSNDLENHLKDLTEIETEMRQISHRLNTGANLKDISFADLMYDLILKSSQVGKFEFDIHVAESIDWDDVNEVIFINLYRILQEAMHNIVKYACAKHVSVSISTVSNMLRLEIKDNGIGFTTETQKTGIGLKNMRSRVKKIQGVLFIKSEINNGSLIICEIPLKVKK